MPRGRPRRLKIAGPHLTAAPKPAIRGHNRPLDGHAPKVPVEHRAMALLGGSGMWIGGWIERSHGRAGDRSQVATKLHTRHEALEITANTAKANNLQF